MRCNVTCVATSTNRGNLHVNALRALGSTPTIEASAFRRCGALELTHLPEGLTTIRKSAFSRCYALALTQLPHGITTIEQGTFKNCHALPRKSDKEKTTFPAIFALRMMSSSSYL